MSRIGAVIMGMGVLMFVSVRVFMGVLVGVFGSILVGMIVLVLVLVVMSVFVAVFMVTFHGISPSLIVARTLQIMTCGLNESAFVLLQESGLPERDHSSIERGQKRSLSGSGLESPMHRCIRTITSSAPTFR
jgi:MFS family permease